MGVEQGGVQVAQRLVALVTEVRQANVTTRHIEVATGAGHDQERSLRANAVVSFSILREIHDHRIVEHGAFALGDLLESFDDRIDLVHVTDPDLLPSLPSGHASKGFIMPQGVDTDTIGFIPGQPGDRGTEVINGVSHHIGQTGFQGCDQHVGHGCLLFGRARI